MWLLTVHVPAPAAGYIQELRQLLDRRDADTYLVERRAHLYLASPDRNTVQYVAAWTLNNAKVQALVMEYVRE